MNITLKNITKKYQKSFIFKNLSFVFEEGKKYAVVGSNGSGKSTLMKIVAGYVTATKGEISYGQLTIDDVYKKISYCAPYLDLIEEMTLLELLDFHKSYKPLLPHTPPDFIVNLLGFDSEKLIKDYSSGMKQRVKLALAFFSDVELIILDEPTTNLDAKGVEWYLHLVENYSLSRTLIVASNIEREYNFCEAVLEVEAFK
jgi:ABC-type multidrug transport system ATPase subunit